MTCKEKIDEIEKILDDEYEVKIGRIRRIVEDSEDKAIPLEKVKQAREEIKYLRLHKAEFMTSDNKVCIDSGEVLKILDKLIAENGGK